MKRYKLIRNKPRIFQSKVKLANKIKKEWIPISFHKWSHGFRGEFKSENELFISVYIQLYVRHPGVDECKLRWMENYKPLSVKEIRTLLDKT